MPLIQRKAKVGQTKIIGYILAFAIVFSLLLLLFYNYAYIET